MSQKTVQKTAKKPPKAMARVLEEARLPPSQFRIRIGEPCSASIQASNACVDLVVSSAMMKKLLKAPKVFNREDDGGVAYVFGGNVAIGRKYERVGYHNTEVGQTGIVQMDDITDADYDALGDNDKWVRLFTQGKSKVRESWFSRKRLEEVRSRLSRRIAFLGDISATGCDRVNVFTCTDEHGDITNLILDTNCLFPLEPPVQPVAAAVAQVLAPPVAESPAEPPVAPPAVAPAPLAPSS